MESELRRDLVTGEWITIATGRAKRPKEYIKKEGEQLDTTKENCPFEDPQASGNAPPVLKYENEAYKDDWRLQVIPNKFPAFSTYGECEDIREVGPYLVRDGYGFHEVVITRDHDTHLAIMKHEEVTDVVKAYQERYNALKKEECVNYISIFHNHGKDAGASLYHPHSQIIAIPVLPSDIHRSLRGSNLFYRREGECVHCRMVNWELRDKTRIVHENDKFVAFCPFVSRAAFEIRIFPKKQQAYFEATPQEDLPDLADALRASLRALYDLLDNPDYNFFIHTAPVDTRKYPNYHWHIEIRPKTAIAAGFELGTGIEISTMNPEGAAQHLRESLQKNGK